VYNFRITALLQKDRKNMQHNRSPLDASSLDYSSVLEEPACPVCQNEHATAAFEAADDWIPDGNARKLRFSVVRCNACGTFYTTPRFRETEKQLAFAGSYPFYLRARRDAGAPSNADMQAFAQRVSLVEKFCPQRGTILDMGMGDGVFLASMQQRGWNVAGIDTEADVVEFARQRLGLEACAVADAEQDQLPAGPFDVVTMWGMFQLAYRPHQLLEKVRSSLSSRGIIAIGVSNIGSAGARLFGSHWRGLGLPRHLVHYDPATLSRMVEGAGFTVLAVSFETPYWITGPSAASALPLPGILGKIARRCLHGLLSLGGRSRLGDTMILIARADREPTQQAAACAVRSGELSLS
jgi:2-polyprenyl-3-methyl-5-hydroxy-6-metoxy-1,4-benzoquinol methylase